MMMSDNTTIFQTYLVKITFHHVKMWQYIIFKNVTAAGFTEKTWTMFEKIFLFNFIL